MGRRQVGARKAARVGESAAGDKMWVTHGDELTTVEKRKRVTDAG